MKPFSPCAILAFYMRQLICIYIMNTKANEIWRIAKSAFFSFKICVSHRNTIVHPWMKICNVLFRSMQETGNQIKIIRILKRELSLYHDWKKLCIYHQTTRVLSRFSIGSIEGSVPWVKQAKILDKSLTSVSCSVEVKNENFLYSHLIVHVTV